MSDFNEFPPLLRAYRPVDPESDWLDSTKEKLVDEFGTAIEFEADPTVTLVGRGEFENMMHISRKLGRVYLPDFVETLKDVVPKSFFTRSFNATVGEMYVRNRNRNGSELPKLAVGFDSRWLTDDRRAITRRISRLAEQGLAWQRPYRISYSFASLLSGDVPVKDVERVMREDPPSEARVLGGDIISD